MEQPWFVQPLKFAQYMLLGIVPGRITGAAYVGVVSNGSSVMAREWDNNPDLRVGMSGFMPVFTQGGRNPCSRNILHMVFTAVLPLTRPMDAQSVSERSWELWRGLGGKGGPDVGRGSGPF